MSKPVVISNARIVDPATDRDSPGAILIENGRIAGITNAGPQGVPDGAEVFDARGLVVGRDHAALVLLLERLDAAGVVVGMVRHQDVGELPAGALERGLDRACLRRIDRGGGAGRSVVHQDAEIVLEAGELMDLGGHVTSLRHSNAPAPALANPWPDRLTYTLHATDGKVGTRNYIGILTSVNCSASVARFMAEEINRSGLLDDYPNVDGVIPLVHGGGCALDIKGEGYEVLKRTQWGYATNPNMAAVVMVGLGGIHIEVLKDVAFRKAPVTAAEAGRMLEELKGRAILGGVRGRPAIDRGALERMISAVSVFGAAAGGRGRAMAMSQGPSRSWKSICASARRVSSLPEERSSSICESHTTLSNSANQRRNSASSFGSRERTASSRGLMSGMAKRLVERSVCRSLPGCAS